MMGIPIWPLRPELKKTAPNNKGLLIFWSKGEDSNRTTLKMPYPRERCPELLPIKNAGEIRLIDPDRHSGVRPSRV
jgi:hypothetical protein